MIENSSVQNICLLHLQQQRLTEIYFICWAVIQYCYVFCCLNCSNFGHQELLCAFHILLHFGVFLVGWLVFFFFLTFLYFLALQDAVAHFVYSQYQYQVSHFPKEPWFLFLESSIRSQNLCAGCAYCYKGVIASCALSVDRARKYIYLH